LLSSARSSRGVALAGVIVLGMSRVALAQTAPLPPVAVPPLNVMLPNYDSVPVGEIASLEAGAFLVRANDTSSVFYNPAGLVYAERTSISGSAGVFQFDSVTPRGLLGAGTSFQQIPSMFGFVLKDLLGRPNWAGGLSIARVNAWGQEVAAEKSFQVGAATDRISYTSSAAMDGWMVNIGAGYKASDRLRVGGSLDGQLTMTDRSQTLGDQYNTGTALSTVLVESKGWAWMTHLRLTAGGQYDVTPKLQVGAVLRTRGWGVLSDGASNLEGVSRIGASTTTGSFFDDEAAIEYRIPFEFKAGAAYRLPRGQVEIDLKTYLGAGIYDGISSDRPTTILSDAGAGSVTTQQLTTVPTVIDSRAVVNVAVGGHYDLTADGKWVVHGGYATDRSPVGDQDTLFTKVHLQKLTLGVSGRTKYFLGSLGVQYASGSSGTILLRELQNGQRFTTTFDVANLGFVYSLALLF
jgi:long-subunit fatty acid transport protein